MLKIRTPLKSVISPTGFWVCVLATSIALGGCDQPSQPQQEKTQQPISSNQGSPNTTTSPTAEASAHQKSSSMRVGILDFNKVWNDAKAPQQIREEIQTKRRQYQKEIIALEEQLRREELKLRAKHETLSASEYQTRRKEFESQVLAVQKQAQAHKKQLEKAYGDAMAQVSTRLNDIVKEIALKRKLSLILSQTQVAFNEVNLDITPQVMAELDASLPSVEFSN